MQTTNKTTTDIEVHDSNMLAHTRAILDACHSPKDMAEAVLAAVARNEEWRGKQCINLLAPEAPTSPTVRALLSAEVGTRAAEGHIGALNRWFAGTQYIDEIEALCVELLKKVFRARYADHRLCDQHRDGWQRKTHQRRHDGARQHRAATGRLGVDRGRLNLAVLDRGLRHVIAPVVTCSVRKRVRSSLISVGRSC